MCQKLRLSLSTLSLNQKISRKIKSIKKRLTISLKRKKKRYDTKDSALKDVNHQKVLKRKVNSSEFKERKKLVHKKPKKTDKTRQE